VFSMPVERMAKDMRVHGMRGDTESTPK